MTIFANKNLFGYSDLELKYNPNRDERGRFAEGPGSESTGVDEAIKAGIDPTQAREASESSSLANRLSISARSAKEHRAAADAHRSAMEKHSSAEKTLKQLGTTGQKFHTNSYRHHKKALEKHFWKALVASS